jgi:hypothetical protein
MPHLILMVSRKPEIKIQIDWFFDLDKYHEYLIYQDR